MSAQFVAMAGLQKVTAVFRPFASNLVKSVYAEYLQELHNMQSMDVEMPADEKPTTLKKLLKRYFKVLDDPMAPPDPCSGCQQKLRLQERKLTHFPKYMTLLLKREYRVAGVRAVSNRIVEIPLTKTYKLLGQRYEVTSVVTRQTMLAG